MTEGKVCMQENIFKDVLLRKVSSSNTEELLFELYITSLPDILLLVLPRSYLAAKRGVCMDALC